MTEHATAASPAISVRERPWLFAILGAPVSVLQYGMIQGVLSLLLRHQGVSLDRSARIVSLLILTQTIYFLWSPVTDFWLRRRTWLVVSGILCAATFVVAFHIPDLSSTAAVATLFLSACFGQIVIAACGGIMGALKQEAARRRASSFYQGGGLAIGAGTIFVVAMLLDHTSVANLGWIVGAMIGLPVLAATLAPAQPQVALEGFSQAIRRISTEFRATFWRREAIPYTLIMLFPAGSGAAIGLLTHLAGDFRVDAAQIAWMNGIGGTLLTALGALGASLIPIRLRASVAYLLVCLGNGAALLVLWLAPLTPATYFLGATLYLFTIGGCYAMFTAVVLEFLGDSGKSGSARYSIINSLGNVPVAYMATLDGLGYAHWGTRGMPATDAVLSIGSACALLLYFLLRGRITTTSVITASVPPQG